jgi:hypothetical protein
MATFDLHPIPKKQMMAIATIVLHFITKLLFSIQSLRILYLNDVKTKSLPVRQIGLPDFARDTLS